MNETQEHTDKVNELNDKLYELLDQRASRNLASFTILGAVEYAKNDFLSGSTTITDNMTQEFKDEILELIKESNNEGIAKTSIVGALTALQSAILKPQHPLAGLF